MNRWFHWKLPLWHDVMGCYIFDADNNLVAEMCGWGHLTGKGGLNLDDETALIVQIRRAEAFVNAINAVDAY